jgi:hypothetical protein
MLCTPRNYFSFSSDRPALIVGGGAYNDLGVRDARRFDVPVRVAWALGRSFRAGVAIKALDERTIAATFALATTRDPQFATDTVQLLPCVSALHPIVDTAPGKERGLFLNHDEAASGGEIDHILRRKEEGCRIATNSLPETEFLSAFAHVGQITTNSYHAAYWALLSGRSVNVVGYSTKFTNLLALLGLDGGAVIPYRRGDSESLARALQIAENREPLSLRDPSAFKARFREMNMDFAELLGKYGIVAREIARRPEPQLTS